MVYLLALGVCSRHTTCCICVGLPNILAPGAVGLVFAVAEEGILAVPGKVPDQVVKKGGGREGDQDEVGMVGGGGPAVRKKGGSGAGKGRLEVRKALSLIVPINSERV